MKKKKRKMLGMKRMNEKEEFHFSMNEEEAAKEKRTNDLLRHHYVYCILCSSSLYTKTYTRIRQVNGVRCERKKKMETIEC